MQDYLSGLNEKQKEAVLHIDGPLMIIAGPLIAILDLAYRFKSKNGHWFIPHRGGSLFFLPVWTFGAFWFVLGIVYTLPGRG